MLKFLTGVIVAILMPRYVQAICKASNLMDPVGPASRICDSFRANVRQIEAIVSNSKSLTTVRNTISSVSEIQNNNE